MTWKCAGSSTSDKNVMINTCDIFRPHLGLKVHEAVHYNSLRKNIFHLYLFQSGIWYAITKVWVKLWPPSSSSEWCSEQLFLEAWVTGDLKKTELCVMIYIMNDLHFILHIIFSVWHVDLAVSRCCWCPIYQEWLLHWPASFLLPSSCLQCWDSLVDSQSPASLLSHPYSVRPLSQVLRLWLNVNIKQSKRALSYMCLSSDVEWVDIHHRRLVCIIDSLAWAVGSTSLSLFAFCIRDWRWLTVAITSPLLLSTVLWW